MPKLVEVACWAHARRKIYDVHVATGSAAARDALDMIAQLFAIEAAIRGQSPTERCAARRQNSAPILAELKSFLDATLAKISGKSSLAGAIRYATSRWAALTRYVDDGHLEMSNNAAERAIRPIALGRKNFLFAGSDAGGRRAAIMYTLIETALCRARHKQVYAARRTMPNGSRGYPSNRRICGPTNGRRPSSIRHSLVAHSASRKASRRSLGRKRVRLPRSYGLSLARAASLSARWACR